MKDWGDFSAVSKRLRHGFWLVCLPLLAGCGGGSNPSAAPPPTEVVIDKVATFPVAETLAAVGTIEANEIVQLKPETAAVIKAIHFTEGQQVPEGAKLFDMDAGKESALVAQAAAEEELARQNLERAKQLIGTKAISRQELDQRESEVRARAAARRLQEERLQDMEITAPFAGVLGPRRVSVGQYVNAGQDLVTLVDSSRVKVTYHLPERELARVRLGQEVKLSIAAYPNHEFNGVVDLINPVVNPETRTAEIRATAANPEALLKPGMFARVETIVDRRAAAVVIPEGALVPSLAGFAVYVVVDGRARLTSVQIGVRGRGTVEIGRGLSAGQDIVTEGTQKLVDGMAVTSATPAGPQTAAVQVP